MIKYDLDSIKKKVHKPQAYFIKLTLPIFSRITWFLANYTKITPNFVTIVSLISFLLGAYFFYNKLFLIGALFVFLRNLLDGVDGTLARITNRTSRFGEILDYTSNYIGTAACLVAIFLSMEVKLILLISPFVIISLFLFSIQTAFLYLYVPYLIRRNCEDFLSYFDSRTMAVLVIPFFYFLLKKLPITFNNILIYMIILIFVRQILWLLYYKNDIVNSFKKDVDIKEKYRLSKGFSGSDEECYVFIKMNPTKVWSLLAIRP